ncbi:MAG: threonine/serine ThrE exporter family protein [Bacteroidales bacterium]
MPEQKKIYEVSDLLLDYAISLMGAGSHTARVVRNLVRVADSLGYDIDLTMFQKNVTMMVKDRETLETVTAVRRIKPMALNFNIISQLSSLSWTAYDEHLNLYDIQKKYHEIMHSARLSRWTVLFLVACANASFCRLFGGDAIAMGLVFIATLIGFFVRQEMMNRHLNHFVVFITSAFVASITAGMGVVYQLGSTADVALATSVLFLIPGVPLINSIMDILEGYVLAGMSRMINATILIICISIGFFMTLLTLGIEKL